MGTDNETALSFSKHVKSVPESSLATVGKDAVHPSVHSQTKCVEAAALDIQSPLATSLGRGGGARCAGCYNRMVCSITGNPQTPTLPDTDPPPASAQSTLLYCYPFRVTRNLLCLSFQPSGEKGCLPGI